jgi:hypothetical protein
VKASYLDLQRECEGQLIRATYAVRRKQLATKYSVARVARNSVLGREIRREQDALEAEYSHLALTDEDILALPARLRELDERLLSFPWSTMTWTRSLSCSRR